MTTFDIVIKLRHLKAVDRTFRDFDNKPRLSWIIVVVRKQRAGGRVSRRVSGVKIPREPLFLAASRRLFASATGN